MALFLSVPADVILAPLSILVIVSSLKLFVIQ